MFNRPLKTGGIGNSFVDSLSWGGVTAPTCPDAGIFLRSQDTSRPEYDFVGQGFIMPYTTSWYTDGNCGETSSEVWGLQYLPAGWVTAVFISDVYVNPYGSNSFLVGQDEARSTEDGTGINSTLPYQSLYRLPYGTWLMWTEMSVPFEAYSSYYNNFDTTTVTVYAGYYLQEAYLFDGSNGYYTGNYIYSGAPYPDGTYIADQPDSYPEIPTGSGNTFFDGNDNRIEWDGSGNAVFRYSGLYPNGTYITSDGSYDYYWDGAGSYYAVSIYYIPYGTLLVAESSGNNSIQTDCGSMTTGSWFDDADYADGAGGTYNDNTSYSNYEVNGTLVGNCNGNNYFSDGSGGYYTETDGSGDGGGGGGGGDNCEDPSMYAGQEGWSYDGCHWSYTPPPDYPEYGTLLSSDSGNISPTIEWSGTNNGSSVSGEHQAELGTYWSNTYADGTGGSYGESGGSYLYTDPTDVFEAPYGIEIKVDWSVETPDGLFSGNTKWADDVNIWKAHEGSTYMDRLYRRPSIFDGTVIYETPSWNVEGSQWKTQIILQGGGFITNTFSF